MCYHRNPKELYESLLCCFTRCNLHNARCNLHIAGGSGFKCVKLINHRECGEEEDFGAITQVDVVVHESSKIRVKSIGLNVKAGPAITEHIYGNRGSWVILSHFLLQHPLDNGLKKKPVGILTFYSCLHLVRLTMIEMRFSKKPPPKTMIINEVALLFQTGSVNFDVAK